MTASAPVPGEQLQGQVPDCLDEVCVTCSDAAMPRTVVALLDDGLAIVGAPAGEGPGEDAGEEEVSVALVEARVGDTVLVHAGEAIAVMPR
jgi:hydrogenase expression/formation protein HypC